jgi:hypothetical protein
VRPLPLEFQAVNNPLGAVKRLLHGDAALRVSIILPAHRRRGARAKLGVHRIRKVCLLVVLARRHAVPVHGADLQHHARAGDHHKRDAAVRRLIGPQAPQAVPHAEAVDDHPVVLVLNAQPGVPVPESQRGRQRQHGERSRHGPQRSPPHRPASPAPLGIRHHLVDPLPMEDPPVDLVPRHEPPLLAAHNARQAQRVRHRTGRIVRHAAPQKHLAIHVQHRRAVCIPLEHPPGHVLEIDLAFAAALAEEEFVAQAVHVARVRGGGVVGHGAAQPLGEVGLAAGPVEHACQKRVRDGLLAAHAGGQAGGVGEREVGEFDLPSHVEGCDACILNEVGRGGGAQQAERQTIEVSLAAAQVVTLADGGEELVGGEGQEPHVVDLVDEDHDGGV